MSDDLDVLAREARDELTDAVDAAARPVPPVASLARRAARQRSRHAALVAAVAVAAVIVVASAALWATSDGDSSKVVADQSEQEAHPPATTPPRAVKLDSGAPPPLTIRSDSGRIDVTSHAFCWSPAVDDGTTRRGVCGHPTPPTELPDIGTADEIAVTAPWASDVTASTTSPGQQCSRNFPVPVDRQTDGTFRLRAAGYPRPSDVHLSAKGPNGSAQYMFRWTTTVRGPLPRPTARTAVITRFPGPPTFGGVELAIDHLARTPTEATAAITVTDADGHATTLHPARATDTCRADGALYWSGGLPDENPRPAGPAPFRYDVTLILDGVTHTATATWPDDQVVGFEPNVALHFQPPLPGLE